MKFDADALRKVAQAATPGPWECDLGEIVAPELEDALGNRDAHSGRLIGDSVQSADGVFMAAANPAVVLALLDALRSSEGRQ